MKPWYMMSTWQRIGFVAQQTLEALACTVAVGLTLFSILMLILEVAQ